MIEILQLINMVFGDDTDGRFDDTDGRFDNTDPTTWFMF